jgi:hypothetical protein
MRKADASSASNPYLAARRSMASLRILLEKSAMESVKARDMVAENILRLVMQTYNFFHFNFFAEPRFRTSSTDLLQNPGVGARPYNPVIMGCRAPPYLEASPHLLYNGSTGDEADEYPNLEGSTGDEAEQSYAHL